MLPLTPQGFRRPASTVVVHFQVIAWAVLHP
jgi:hypothetical protein